MEDALNKSPEEVYRKAVMIAKATLAPRVSSDKPCCEDDFRLYKPVAEKNFEYLQKLLDKLIRENQTLDTALVTSIVVLCAEHSSLQPWSTAASVEMSREILATLCRVHACSTVDQLLVGPPTRDLFAAILPGLRPKLAKDAWKCHPSTVAAFRWLLLQVKFPHLNFESHGMVFTTSLVILDDFVTENKIIGIQCLHHYISNVTATDFRFQGRDVVVYDALFSLLYTREPQILDCLLPCILTTLKKLKSEASTPDEDTTPYVAQWGKFDDVLNSIFSAMLLDEPVEVRMTFLKYLPQFILGRGLPIVVFATRMLAVLSAYLNARGEGSVDLIKTTLEVCHEFMNTDRARFSEHALVMFRLLLRKLNDLKSSDKGLAKADNQAIVKLIVKNVKFLIDSAPELLGKFTEITNSLRRQFLNVRAPRTRSKL